MHLCGHQQLDVLAIKFYVFDPPRQSTWLSSLWLPKPGNHAIEISVGDKLRTAVVDGFPSPVTANQVGNVDEIMLLILEVCARLRGFVIPDDFWGFIHAGYPAEPWASVPRNASVKNLGGTMG